MGIVSVVRSLLLSLAAVLGLALSGCGSADATDATTPTESAPPAARLVQRSSAVSVARSAATKQPDVAAADTQMVSTSRERTQRH